MTGQGFVRGDELDISKRDLWDARIKAPNGAIVDVNINAPDAMTAKALLERQYGKGCVFALMQAARWNE